MKMPPHRIQCRTPFRAVPKPLEFLLNPLRLIDVRKTRALTFYPLRQLVPATTHPLLTHARFRVRAHHCVHWRVISLAEDVLQEMVHAVDEMRIAVQLHAIVLRDGDRAPDFAQAVQAMMRVH